MVRMRCDCGPLGVEFMLKRRWFHFIRKVYETDPLTCPKCHGEMWFDKLLTTLRGPEGRIISFIDQPEVIKKILEHLGLWEKSHAPPNRNPKKRDYF
ncbi:MAG: hypothetical protein A3G94_02890 [Deltaproteobacteria bacterium RIFCSPLOWO2_12_FULL_60_16]|nr:MAG: hypothetical protein A3G94_02890 [Deltaproteobacteria bacterium RIFCSPLOWO2_12_FULL_60_16]